METIHRHPDLRLKTSPKHGIGVFASEKIAAGTIILVEHVFKGTAFTISSFLFSQPRLSASLFPRCNIPSDLTEFRVLLQSKISSNAFKTNIDEDNTMCIGRNFNFFNHSCDPNAHWSSPADATWENVMFRGVYIFTVRDILPNEEITISYGSRQAHGFDHCSKTDDEHTTIANSLEHTRTSHQLITKYNSYMQRYFHTVPEILNTYRQNMTLEHCTLIDLSTPAFIKTDTYTVTNFTIRKLYILSRLLRIHGQKIMEKVSKHIDKLSDKELDLQQYIRITSACYTQVKYQVDWI